MLLSRTLLSVRTLTVSEWQARVGARVMQHDINNCGGCDD
jgi:hypothetical protein